MLDRQKQFKITIRITALIPQGVFLLSLLVASQAVAQSWDPRLMGAAPLQLRPSQGSRPSPPTLGRGAKGSRTERFERGCSQEQGLQDQLLQTSLIPSNTAPFPVWLRIGWGKSTGMVSYGSLKKPAPLLPV